MSAKSGGRKYDETDTRDWLLRCEGFRVDSPDGQVGIVVGVVYEPSARWDRPSALRVRGSDGPVVMISMEDVEDVVAADRRLLVRARIE